MDFFEDSHQGVGAVGTDHITISLNLGPFAVNADDMDDAGGGVALAQEPNGLTGRRGGYPMTEKDDVILLRRLHFRQCFLFGQEGSDLMAGGLEDGSAQVR